MLSVIFDLLEWLQIGNADVLFAAAQYSRHGLSPFETARRLQNGSTCINAGSKHFKAFLREFLMVVGQIGANSGYAVKDGLAKLLRILHIVRKQPRRLHQPTLKGQFGLINGTIRDLKKKSPVMGSSSKTPVPKPN